MKKPSKAELCAKGAHKFIHIGGEKHRCEDCGLEIRVVLPRFL